MKKIFLCCIALALLGFSAAAQPEKCSAQIEFDQYMLQHPEDVPGVNLYLEQIIRESARFMRLLESLENPDLHQSPVTIPVVVHIIYKNATELFTDKEVEQAIDNLNLYFRKKNEIRKNVPARFAQDTSDAYIEFRLARRGPNGEKVGITRHEVDPAKYPDFDKDDARQQSTGGVDPWDESKYLNIWVVDMKAGALGVATFPENPLKSVAHGINIDYAVFALGARSLPEYNQGKTLVHEIGHFLGLRHIWGDNGGSDFVDDTPPATGANYGCNPCRKGSTYKSIQTPNNEMYVNYMDYSNDPCLHMFTRGQVARMLANLAPGGRRASLITSPALLPANVTERSHDITLEPESRLPSWEASFLMVYRWLLSQKNEKSYPTEYVLHVVEELSVKQKKLPTPLVPGMPEIISRYAYILGFEVERVEMTFTPDAFFKKLDVPLIMLSAGNSALDSYGLVIKGGGFHEPSSTVYLNISDPLNVGPRGFNFKYEDYKTPVKNVDPAGSEYIVDYARFLTDALYKAYEKGKTIFILHPPRLNAY